MKKLTIITTAILLSVMSGSGQQINWKAFTPDQRHIIHLNAGLEYGAVIGIGYGYKLPSALPVMLSVDYSFPAGEKLLDDFKTRIGGQAAVVQLGRFATTLKAYGVFRRYRNEATRLLNFGSEFGAVAGYYQRNWHIGAELGFDKAITTQVRHSPLMRENFPGAQDGWYVPTGGNFLYGIQSGVSLSGIDFQVKLGKVLTQDFKTAPLLPFYAQLGINKRF